MELIPKAAVIKKVINESNDVKSFLLELDEGKPFSALLGQFVEITVQGIGESTFAISRQKKGATQFIVSVKKMGHLTKMLHRLTAGEFVGVRGPYGNSFPLEEWYSKKLLIIGGGIGLAPLRPVIDQILLEKDKFAGLEIVFGARSPLDILFKEDLKLWESDPYARLHTTIDIPYEGWHGKVGFIPSLVKDLALKPDNSIAVICGPPIMIRLTVEALKAMNWKAEQIFTTLEMKMQCGIGQCGRCNIGGKLICKDGPVFRIDQIPYGVI
ncbi:MAG: FAD/NAD(P)-binding protein [Candidatus Stygibacter australis]|nr:FAD/NAD(P)-binding protein [Candidatus Stygibacter australis]MDP8321822.1 FAD/NAD(P)-binding protein [Candidatus Stygibacter australis]